MSASIGTFDSSPDLAYAEQLRKQGSLEAFGAIIGVILLTIFALVVVCNACASSDPTPPPPMENYQPMTPAELGINPNVFPDSLNSPVP